MRFFKMIVNEDQLKVVQDALENHARLGIGQLEVIFSNLGFRTYEQFKDVIVNLETPEAKKAIEALKYKIFNMTTNESMSLRSNSVHENFRVAYDLFLSIQEKLSSGIGKITVTSATPYKLSSNGVVEIEITEPKESTLHASGTSEAEEE